MDPSYRWLSHALPSTSLRFTTQYSWAELARSLKTLTAVRNFYTSILLLKLTFELTSGSSEWKRLQMSSLTGGPERLVNFNVYVIKLYYKTIWIHFPANVRVNFPWIHWYLHGSGASQICIWFSENTVFGRSSHPARLGMLSQSPLSGRVFRGLAEHAGF